MLELGSVYFGACLIVYALAMALARVLLGAGLANGAMIGLNASYGNTVMMGIPIIAAFFGEAALSSLLGIIALHSVLLLPLATVLIEAGSAGRSGFRYTVRATTGGLVRNPIIIAIVLLWPGAERGSQCRRFTWVPDDAGGGGTADRTVLLGGRCPGSPAAAS